MYVALWSCCTSVCERSLYHIIGFTAFPAQNDVAVGASIAQTVLGLVSAVKVPVNVTAVERTNHPSRYA